MRLFAHRLHLMTTAASVEALSPNTMDTWGLPAVALAGRSNVGKSTLLNALTPSHLAAVSDRPGETQALHFYRLAHALVMVDLPGYGFAYANPVRHDGWMRAVRTRAPHRHRRPPASSSV